MLPKYLKSIFFYGCCVACRYRQSCKNINPKFYSEKRKNELRAGYCEELAAIFRFIENKIDTGDFIDDYIYEQRNKS